MSERRDTINVSDAASGAFRTTSIAMIALTLAFCIGWLFIIPAYADEGIFCHSAYLLGQGERPFVDFLFHNPPPILWILAAYKWFVAEPGPEILYWGRGCCAVSMIVSSVLIYRLARLGADRLSAAIGTCAYLIFMVLPTHSLPLARAQYFMIRPEIFAMPFVLAGLATLLGGFDAGSRSGSADRIRAIVVGFLFGISVCVSLRGLFLVLAALATSRPTRMLTLSGAFLASAVFALTTVVGYFGVYGWDETWFWIYGYTKSVTTPAMDFKEWAEFQFAAFRTFPGKFLILLSVPGAILLCFPRILGRESDDASQRTTALGWTHLLQFAAPLSETRAYFASWQMIFVVAMIVNAIALSRLRRIAGSNTNLRVAYLTGFVGMALAVAYPLSQAGPTWIGLIRHPELRLSAQIRASRILCESIDGEPVYAQMKHHPIATRKATYVIMHRDTYEAYLAKHPEHTFHDAVAEILASRPVFVFLPFFLGESHSLEEPKMQALLADYDRLGDEWLMLKTRRELLDDPRVASERRLLRYHLRIPFGGKNVEHGELPYD